MRIADLSTGSARLRDATDTLLASWADAKEFWNDANSQGIEEAHLRPIAHEVQAALAAISHLKEVLDRAQRDCESW